MLAAKFGNTVVASTSRPTYWGCTPLNAQRGCTPFIFHVYNIYLAIGMLGTNVIIHRYFKWLRMSLNVLLEYSQSNELLWVFIEWLKWCMNAYLK